MELIEHFLIWFDQYCWQWHNYNKNRAKKESAKTSKSLQTLQDNEKILTVSKVSLYPETLGP